MSIGKKRKDYEAALLMDKYKNFRHLQREAQEGKDFRVITRHRHGATTAVVAPHGGAIEPGTSELAIAIAAYDMHLAIFEGISSQRNSALHITSTHFDEPRCVKVAERSDTVLAIHGEQSADPTAYIGGGDINLRKTISAALADTGIKVAPHHNGNLQGVSSKNICNRCKRGRGIQLELTRGLRETFFHSLTREGRQLQTDSFRRFVEAVRHGLSNGGAL